VFESLGRVELAWTVEPNQRWSATVAVTVEAGEQLRRFAFEVERFLNADAR
jgi:hypothetical protein